MEEKIVG